MIKNKTKRLIKLIEEKNYKEVINISNQSFSDLHSLNLVVEQFILENNTNVIQNLLKINPELGVFKDNELLSYLIKKNYKDMFLIFIKNPKTKIDINNQELLKIAIKSKKLFFVKALFEEEKLFEDQELYYDTLYTLTLAAKDNNLEILSFMINHDAIQASLGYNNAIISALNNKQYKAALLLFQDKNVRKQLKEYNIKEYNTLINLELKNKIKKF